MIGFPEVGCSASRCVIIPRLERHAHYCRYGPGSYCGGRLATPGADQVMASPMYSYGETTGSCMSGRGKGGRGADPAAWDDLKDRPTPRQEFPRAGDMRPFTYDPRRAKDGGVTASRNTVAPASGRR